MIALLLAAVIQQAVPPPSATAEVDRHEAAAGEIIVMTVRIETRGSEPLEVSDPILTNLERRGFREQSQVSIQAGVTTRVTTRQMQFAAQSSGEATIGTVRIKQGDRATETSPISLHITSRPIDASVTLSSRVRAMLGSMEPPEGIQNVALGVSVSPTTVMVGAPVDVVVAAWFPREIRLQLRTPPTLTDPDLRGAWVYPQPVPSGLAATRFVGGHFYDLYVLHAVVFPFSPGKMQIGRAKVAYSLPITYSFLSRELRHEAESNPVTVSVTEQPAAGRPTAFSGMAGSNLRMQMEVTPRSVGVGEGATVNITVAGSGNVALWPEPRVRWPDDVRVYPGDAKVRTSMDNGRIVGSKRFTYLVVPDSAGVHAIRDVSVPFLDLETRRYAELRASSVDIIAAEIRDARTGAVVKRAEPPPLSSSEDRPFLPTDGWPPLTLALILLGAPLAALAVRGASGLLARRRKEPPPPTRSLQGLHREFRGALERLVPAAGLREGDQLADALRAAGVDPAVAAHAARVRDRLRHAVYGSGGATDPDELIAEAQEVLRALTGEAPEGSPGSVAAA